MATDAALFALRAAFAAVFVAHGVEHYRNRATAVSWTASVGFRGPGVQWSLMTFTAAFGTLAAAGQMALLRRAAK